MNTTEFLLYEDTISLYANMHEDESGNFGLTVTTYTDGYGKYMDLTGESGVPVTFESWRAAYEFRVALRTARLELLRAQNKLPPDRLIGF